MFVDQAVAPVLVSIALALLTAATVDLWSKTWLDSCLSNLLSEQPESKL